MREGWEIKTLGEVCEIFDRKRKPISKRDREPGPYPYYGASCIQDYVSGYLFDGRYLLIGEDGAKWGPGEDTAYIAEGKFWVNNHAHIVKAKEGYLDDFLRYYIKHLDLNPIVAGAIIPKLTQEKLATLEVPIPSLTEQQRIVDTLDREFAKIDALKANAEKSLQAAKDLFQATLKNELKPKAGWKEYCLKDVCTDYGDYGMSLPSKAYESVRYLRITDITEWGELNNDRVSVDTDFIEDRYMLKDGDVLFARTGATVGKTLVYEDAFGDCCYAGYLIRYRPNQDIVLPRMLYFITHSASYYEWVATNQKSATLPNISAKLYNAFELTLPSIKEQKEIVSRLDDLTNKSKALNGNYQKTLTLCDDLKQSILRKAFNGEL